MITRSGLFAAVALLGTSRLVGAAVPEPRERIGLVVSGGISLGAYEAGVNWALVRYIKRHRPGVAHSGPTLDLGAMTGASAGNINALLTAISWCHRDDDDDKERVDSNLFWNTWVPVGLDNLFPADRDCGHYAAAACVHDRDPSACS